MQPTHSSNRILLPVKGWFIFLTLIVALFLDMIPVGRAPILPDFVALILAFWSVREPLRVGMSVAFLLGIAMDVSAGSVMGQHSLAYVLLSYAAGGLSKRILWFPLGQQALHILPLLLGTQLVMFVARMMGGGEFPGVLYFASSVTSTLLWYPLTYLLLLPQYRPLEKDENRPI